MKRCFGIIILGFFLATPSFAKGWVGVLGGYEMVDTQSFTVYGGTLGLMLGSKVGIGGVYTRALEVSKKIGGITNFANHTFYGGDLLFFVGQKAPLHLGARVGMSKVSGSSNYFGLDSSAVATKISAGPVLGVDLRLSTKFTLGVDAAMLWVKALEYYNVLMFTGALKFWF